MHGQDALVFLLSLGLILGVARLLGETARAFGLPLVVGELLTGLLLGATGLQRVLPGVHAWLFPPGAPAEMLSGYTTVAVVLLLVVAGLEVDLGIVRRRGKSALVVAALGIVMPARRRPRPRLPRPRLRGRRAGASRALRRLHGRRALDLGAAGGREDTPRISGSSRRTSACS